MIQTDNLIIGGGLSGLAIAMDLARRGCDFLLLEARTRLGGRILAFEHEGLRFDMGPAWFWPGQPRIAAMIEALDLTTFEQFSDGDLVFEDERGDVHRGRGYASMQGSYRLQGGFAALIDGLAERLPQEKILVGQEVISLERSERGIRVETAQGDTVSARQVVLAMPPRIAGQITYLPDLPAAARQTLRDVPTWMAGQAKAVVLFDAPFWREAGFSGDAMSRFGPMVEIHDASPDTDGSFALFGFIGVPPKARQDEPALKEAIVAQLVRLFGSRASNAIDVQIKDWASDAYTATEADLAPLSSHPRYGMPRALERLWDGHLIFAGSEVAMGFGGYLEGALEAAEAAIERLDAEKG